MITEPELRLLAYQIAGGVLAILLGYWIRLIMLGKR